MSTPLSTLPLKTQQTSSTASADVNDINDPIVQDVLNEFQEELRHSSNQSKPYPQNPQMPMPAQMQPPYPQHPQQHPQHSQQNPTQHPQNLPMQSMMYPSQNWGGSVSGVSGVSGNGSVSAGAKNNGNKYDSIASYLDIEVAKRSLILVIVSLIIYHSGIINIAYDKMPDYLQDNLANFDIYIKSASLFSIIYVLSFFEYI
jgi:hypothetical protein